MFTVNITKQLKEKARHNAQQVMEESQKALQGVIGHLADADKETRESIKYFGTSNSISELKSNLRANQGILNEGLVSIDDIRRICLQYNLRFRPTSDYIKAVPFAALDDIRKFKGSCGNAFDKSNLFIIAPKNHFQSITVDEKDPVVLYRRTAREYSVVTSFGNDFTVFRRLQGFWKSYPGFLWTMTSAMIPQLICLALYPHIRNHHSTFVIICGLISLIVFIAVITFPRFDKYEDNWNEKPVRK